jgi:putative ABC transport system ATP-binding protein
VLITHDAELAGRCERIARMKDGRIDGSEPGAAALALSGA